MVVGTYEHSHIAGQGNKLSAPTLRQLQVLAQQSPDWQLAPLVLHCLQAAHQLLTDHRDAVVAIVPLCIL